MTRELLPTADGKPIRAVLGKLLRTSKARAAGALTMLVGATAIGLLTARLLGHIVDLVIEKRPATELATPVVALVLVAVAQAIATALGVSLTAKLGETLLAELRERFVERALGLPLEQIERAGSGDLTARVTNDVTVVARAVREALPELGRSVLTIVLTLGALAVLDWRFLLAALLAAPIQLHTVRWYVRNAVPLYAKQRIATGSQQQQLLDTIGGAKTVRAFRLADAHVERVRQRSEGAMDLMLRGVRLMTKFFARLNLAEFIGLSAVLAAGFLLVGANAVTVGAATAAALYFHSLFGPINTALALVDDAQAAAASLARLIGVADLPAPREPERPARPVDASVKAAGISHSYVDGHPVLRDVDLDLSPGERVALVGASGAGKTTLAKLIAGIHTPAAGTISVGGVPLDELGPSATRRAVALISQEVHVFAGSLADDLRLARPDASDADLVAALEKVGARGWAEALGLATVVGEGGHRLTVTQAQQLALARLVLADPPIAILDEATAEAGSAGAKTLEAAAAAALEGRTGLVVAHRLTQAAASDRVVVLDAGVIVESGTHDELVATGGQYATLWAAWSDNRSQT
ncbi:ABC transporter, CydDC cysteine exporter (CydDC-E) family, permease/ATP-binding protein CydC [Amycolatopsis japonica]|uniref:ABC transporter, CydDC cysteine exporter (CydDC-E) family, permease/ATP-binding protein CydC n=1 Tax=Amycolatopsis japonica TaxID=208439 RepID=A0A075UVE5_9PSEU|nr:ABC transporter ATP-binding protein [Amycolatopsis japonica]AIG77013.1 ABC transporter, CydDC cysteine exporter (CydDC-E) family, permease/ATP-binding protein CydC [Amycolatopsis japonica]